MGQGGKVNIINNTNSRMIKHYEHSYQMDSWSFPDTIEPGKTVGVYVEWDEGIFKTEKDDAGEVYYHLEKDENKVIEIHMWNCNEKNFTVTMKGFPEKSSEPQARKWQHDGIMPINVFDIQIDLSKWMSKVNNNTPINKMSIPGTHDTLTYELPYATPWAYGISHTQRLNVEQQLNAGCRFLDLRFNHKLQGRHEFIDCKDGLKEAMECAVNFLKTNQREAIFMRLKLEGKDSEKKVDDEYQKNIKELYEKYKDVFWVNDSASGFPVLDDIRSKIVVLDNLTDHYFSNQKIGYQYNADTTFSIQDDYSDPEKEVKYDEIINKIKEPYVPNKMKVNYISANSEMIDEFDWIPKEYAEYLNPRVVDFITREAIEKDYILGITAFDFYEPDFGAAVVFNNTIE